MRKYTLPNLLLSLIFMLSALAVTAFAQPVSVEDYSITVRFVTENGAVSGSEFNIYRALENSEKPELIGDFADYSIDVDNFDSSSSVDAISTTLAAYAARDNITPYATAATNAAGECSFSDLESGIYLIVGSSVTVDNIKYTPKPALVRIPYLSEEGSAVTDAEIEVKYELVDVTPEPEPETVERSVVKVWDDANRSDEFRPSSVIIQLLKDGEVYDEVTLDASCDWKHTWTDLDADADWQVAEKDIPKEYLVKITLDGTEFTVTNTFNSSTSGENNNPEYPDEPTKPDQPTKPDEPTKPSNPSTPDEPKLPQTGQLWWPVPVMASLGLVLLLIGIVTVKLNSDEKN